MSKLEVDASLHISRGDLICKELVGEGAYGKVWKGNWNGRGGGEVVAIKVISITGITDKILQELYLEVEILSKLRHKNILQLYGVSIDEREMWIVLDFIAGGSLFSLLHSESTIGWDTRISLAIQATKAVHCLHSSVPPIYHRDIKSPNFLVSRDHGDISLKLTDFGMSKVKMVATASSVSSAKASGGIGSYRWSAPETFAKVPVWTEKSDIFSLGMVFYELASRQIPLFEVTESHQVIYLVKHEKERPDIPPDCPKVFSGIFEKCWAHDPSERPPTADILQMLEAITHHFTPAPAVTSPQTKHKRLFFELNEAELERLVPSDCVVVLTQAPPFPGSGTPPSIPKEVKIVSLKRNAMHPLLSKTYEAQIFERVELYFRRFFVPRDSSSKVTMDEVQVILNQQIEQRFKEAQELMHKKFNGLVELKDEDQSDIQRRYLNHLLTSDNLITTTNSNAISAWHGASTKKLQSIMWYGFLNLSTTDPGFYGKAMYFTQHPKYGEYYAETVKEKNEGSFHLVLCWVLLGRPHAIPKVSMGCECTSGYTSHYTLVTKKRATRKTCATKEDFENVQGMMNYFPVEEGEEVQGDEIGVFDSAHILPRYVVRYTVTRDPNKTFKDADKAPQPTPQTTTQTKAPNPTPATTQTTPQTPKTTPQATPQPTPQTATPKASAHKKTNPKLHP